MVTSNEFFNKIKEYDSIVIFGHVVPDGDCYASLLALKEIIKLNFPDKKVLNTGSGLPQFFDIFGKLDNPSEEDISSSLAILVDVNHPDRAEDQRVHLAKEVIKIDHHLEEKPFDGVKYLDTNCISCSQMITELVVSHNLKINEYIANVLYLGIVTDSGRFMYTPMDGKTFELVSYLFSYNVDFKKIYDVLYENDPKLTRYKGYMLLNYQVSNGVCYFIGEPSLYQSFDLTYDDVSGIVNVLNSIKGCPIWLLFTKNTNGIIRVEYRSNGLNINPIAVKYGGGGHKHASGCRINDEKLIPLIIKDCEELIKKGE